MELNGLSDPIDNNVTRIHLIDAHDQQPALNPPKPADPCFEKWSLWTRHQDLPQNDPRSKEQRQQSAEQNS